MKSVSDLVHTPTLERFLRKGVDSGYVMFQLHATKRQDGVIAIEIVPEGYGWGETGHYTVEGMIVCPDPSA